MTKRRSHGAAFKRQVAEKFIGGETLHALSKRHDISTTAYVDSPLQKWNAPVFRPCISVSAR